MLSVTDLNHFYYIRNFIDMRCKHYRVLSIIRERLYREPGDAPESPKHERDLSNRLDGYNTMSVVGAPVFHPSELSKVPGRIIERKPI